MDNFTFSHKRQLTYASIFSGIGGWDKGFEDGVRAAGGDARCLWMCEKDKAARGVLHHHWPDVTVHPDVTGIDPREVERPDVLLASPPCQAFSVAGKRLSLADARGNLSLYTATLINELDPEYVLIENVPGWLSTSDNAFGCFLAALVGADDPLPPIADDGGWPSAGVVVGPKRAVGWRVLDAQYFGVAQRRRRVFLVGHSGGSVERVTQVLFEPESVRRHSPPSREKGQRVADSLTSGSHPGSNAPGRHREDDANIVQAPFGIDRDKNATVDFFGTLQSFKGERGHGNEGMGTQLEASAGWATRKKKGP